MKKAFFVLLPLFFSVVIPTSNPETIKLKSGKTIEGKIIKRTEEHIKVDFDGTVLTYYLEDIDCIDMR